MAGSRGAEDTREDAGAVGLGGPARPGSNSRTARAAGPRCGHCAGRGGPAPGPAAPRERPAPRPPPASRQRRRCALARAREPLSAGSGARAEQGFQFLARTSAVPKLLGELARCRGTAAAAGPRAGAGAATRTGIAPAPARGPRCRPCPAAAPRRSAGRPRSARAWRTRSRRIPGTRWWTPRAWRRRPTTACAARSAISTGRSSTRSNVRRGARGGRWRTQARAARLGNGARADPAPPGSASIGSRGRPAPSRGASARPWRGRAGPEGAGRRRGSRDGREGAEAARRGGPGRLFGLSAGPARGRPSPGGVVRNASPRAAPRTSPLRSSGWPAQGPRWLVKFGNHPEERSSEAADAVEPLG